MREPRYAAYYRVSTDKQGRNGLGIDAQKRAVADFLRGSAPLAEFVEVESGKRSDREQLREALRFCSLTGSVLVIAKLDRLSRDLNFITSLQKSEVDFVVCDLPNADKFTINIYGTLAEKEREMISERTTVTLARKREWYKEHEEELKAKGERHKLGNPKNLTAAATVKGREASIEVRQQKASSFASQLLPIVQAYQSEGLSLRGIAAKLEAQGILTARGQSRWTAAAVSRVLDRSNLA